MTARVLVVDDILSNVKLLEAKLTVEYFEVVTAFNGLECLAKMGEGVPDIVLLDVMMPGMDEFEVCRRIKSNPTTAHVPVVMVTALDSRPTALPAWMLAPTIFSPSRSTTRRCSRGCVPWYASR